MSTPRCWGLLGVIVAACGPPLDPAGAGASGSSSTHSTGTAPESSTGTTGATGTTGSTGDTSTEGTPEPGAVTARLVYTSELGVVAHNVRANGEIEPGEVVLEGVWRTLFPHDGGLYSVQSRSSLDWESEDPIRHAVFDPFGPEVLQGIAECPSMDNCRLSKIGKDWYLASTSLEASWGTIHSFSIQDGAATPLQPFTPEVYGGPVAVVGEYFVVQAEDGLYRVSVPDGGADLLAEFTADTEQWFRVEGSFVQLITERTPEGDSARTRVEIADVLASPPVTHDIPLAPGADVFADWGATSHGVLSVQRPREELGVRDVYRSRWDGNSLAPPEHLSRGELKGHATALLIHGLHVSADGRWIAFGAKVPGSPGEIYLLPPDPPATTIGVGEREQDPYFSKNGRYLYFLSWNSGSSDYTAMRVELGGDGTVGATEIVSTPHGGSMDFSDDENWMVVAGGVADLRTSPPTVSETPACEGRVWFVSPDGLIVSCEGLDSTGSPAPLVVHHGTGQVVELEDGAVGARFVPAPE